MASPTLQFKRGLFVNLPELRAGEPGFTTDTSDFYVGGLDENKFFGSHRYWTREDGTAETSAVLKLVDKGGSNSIGLRAPASLADSNSVYTLPELGSEGHYLKLGASGVLEWASVSEGASFENATLTDTTFAGISTFTGSIEAQEGLDVTGGSTFDDIEVTGIATVGELYVGTTQVLYDDGGLITLAGIQTVDATTIATLEALLSLDPNDFNSLNISGISTFQDIAYFEQGIDVTGHTELDGTLEVSGISTFNDTAVFEGGILASDFIQLAGDLTVTGVSTFTGAINADGGVVGDLSGNVTGNLTGVASTATKLETARDFDITGDFITSAAVSFDGTGNVSLAATITENSIELGKYTTGDYVADISGTANEVIVVSGSGEGASIVLGLDDEVIVGTSLSAPTVYAGAVKAEDGADAIFIDDITGNVSFASTVTITGDLQVLGSTTTVNTETLLVKDPVIELGLVDDNGALVPPSSATATDLGLVFHYYDTSAKTSAFYWDHNTDRFVLASTLDSFPTTTGQIEADAFAALEVSSLYISGCGTEGAQQVFGCVNDEVTLLNTVVDCGEF
jgi:hypothetical protein